MIAIDIGKIISSHWGELVAAIALIWTVIQEIRTILKK